jgi:hypothetical protein
MGNKNWIKEGWFKAVIALAVLLYSVGFVLNIYWQHKIDVANLKFKAVSFAAESNSGSLMGKKEVQNFKEFYWELLNSN